MTRMDQEFLSKGMRELGSCALYLHFGWLEQFVRMLRCEENVSLRLDSDYAHRVWLWFRYDSGNYEYSRSLEIIYLSNSLPKRTNNL